MVTASVCWRRRAAARGDHAELVTSPHTTLPVDTPLAVKVQSRLAALAVLLMVSVLPVIPAELSRPTLATPLMLSELPDTARVDDSVAGACCERSRRLRPTRGEHVRAVTSLRSSWSQPTLRCAVSPSSVSA